MINLARKWRSKQFDEIVGQTLAIRLLKNSLYRNLIFPVYLLSGTRGTGKTSTARIFAAALNCKKLVAFQKDPQNNPLPCLSCDSCTAMQQMMHPDVIEIDAASNTGVDNVRNIIEAASFIPVMGGKKIYLIDEAHMLSKAAFNAFLKILEEPPQSAVFMLITTDPHKIIPTVLSRCFQVFFDPIKVADVTNHLAFVCGQENISADPDALVLIAQETEGCMRDALNLLERLRALPELTSGPLLSSTITKEMVFTVLGTIDDERVGFLLLSIVEGDAVAVLNTWQQREINRFSPHNVWLKLVDLLRRSLWLKHAVSPDEVPISPMLQKIVDRASYKSLIRMLEICYEHELTFAKTSEPATLLELIILKMALPGDMGTSVTTSKPPAQSVPESAKSSLKQDTPALRNSSSKNIPQEVPQKIHTSEVSPVKSTIEVSLPNGVPDNHGAEIAAEVVIYEHQAESIWNTCIKELVQISDPLIASIFKQCAACEHNEADRTVTLTFSQDLLFFKDWLQSSEKLWRKIIEKFYGEGTQLKAIFDGVSIKQRPLVIGPIKPLGTQLAQQAASGKTPMRAQSSVNSQKSVSSSAVTSSQKRTGGATAEASQLEAPQGKEISSQGLTIGSLVTQAFPGRLLVHDTTQEGV